MERRCYEYFARIDALGGMVEAVKQSFPQREIADAAFELQTEIDQGRRIVVGVNAFTEGNAADPPTLRIDPDLERKQIDRVKALRARRDSGKVMAALCVLKDVASTTDTNLMPALLDCARAHAPEGELVEALQEVFGSYTEVPVF